MSIVNHQIFLLARDWSKHVASLNMLQLKLGNIQAIFPNFQNCACCENDLKDNKHKSLHLAWKFNRIFVLGQYLILEAYSWRRAKHSENCLLLGTHNVHGQISETIIALNWGYCLFSLVFQPDSKKNWRQTDKKTRNRQTDRQADRKIVARGRIFWS